MGLSLFVPSLVLYHYNYCGNEEYFTCLLWFGFLTVARSDLRPLLYPCFPPLLPLVAFHSVYPSKKKKFLKNQRFLQGRGLGRHIYTACLNIDISDDSYETCG